MSVQLTASSSQFLYDDAILSTPASYATTLGCWFYLDSTPAASEVFVVACLTLDTFYGWRVHVDENRNLLVYSIADSSGGTPGSTTLALDTWYYLWFRYDGSASGTGYVYLDGSETAECTGTVKHATGDCNLDFGQSNYGGSYFDGSLVGAKLWNEDRAASNADTEKPYGEAVYATNLLGEWHFSESPYSDDYSAATNDLTIGGGPLSAGATDPGGYSENARGAAVTGTIIGAKESEIVSGSNTIILTLTGDTWIPT
jgi:hypothetical protein